jgi:hypothetical protein
MGSCSDLEAVAADLGIVQIGQGAAVGSAGTDSVAQVFGSASIPFATLVASPHAVVVSEDIDAEGDLIACGDIGGTLTDTGALVIALRTQSAGANVGVAVIAPALEDPGVTGVSVFVIESETAANAAATPVSSVD